MNKIDKTMLIKVGGMVLSIAGMVVSAIADDQNKAKLINEAVEKQLNK